jgi:hypothetical protein
VHRTRTLAQRDEALDALLSADFDPRREAILSEAPSPSEAAAVSVAPSSLTGPTLDAPADYVPPPVRIERPSPNEVVAFTSNAHPSLLVLSDVYFPGWEATVDDVSTPVLRANHMMRAVAVPAGEHRVVFRFVRPPGFRAGLWGSAVGLVALVAIVVYSTGRSAVARARHASARDGLPEASKPSANADQVRTSKERT